MTCKDCGCALDCHDSGWCYNEGCCRVGKCDEKALKFDASVPGGRWVPRAMTNGERKEFWRQYSASWEPQRFCAVADATGDSSEPWAQPEAPAKKLRVVVAYGTRPEKIKLAPVVEALKAEAVEVVEWVSGQSKDLVEGDDLVRRWANTWGYGLNHAIGQVISDFDAQLLLWKTAKKPADCVVVQGDTATAFACAQAAFLARVPVAHVEAGLRTYECEPWPEEAFRRQIAAVARWHFCPDIDALVNVMCEVSKNREGWNAQEIEDKRVFVVGNTVIDTLPRAPFRVLVTLHRRENWGARLTRALATIDAFSLNPGVRVSIIRHPNWSAAAPEWNVENFVSYGSTELLAPMPREDLLAELREADLVVTDSGGLQEEAAHFGVPCLVLRTSTERVGLLRTGAVELVDPDSLTALRDALEAKLARRRAYGVGDSGKQIARILVEQLTRVATSVDNAERAG